MYHETKCRIKFQNGISHDFTSTCGVKQNDVLSPTLFNFILYINNLVNDLKIGHTHPLIVGDVTVTSLLYADDIILVSESKEGLQNGLNVLSKFCSSWKLEVNTKKSKIMIFNSNGKSFLNHFKLDNEYFETVKSYCYLGVTISYTGNLNQTSKNLMEKGRKAWFKTRKNYFRYLKLMSPLNAAICTTTYLERQKCYGPGKKILFKKTII